MEKEETQVMRALSPLISRSPSEGLDSMARLCQRYVVRKQFRHIYLLQGLDTSLAEIGTMLPATLKGIDFAFELDSPSWTPAVLGSVRDRGADIVVGGQRETPAVATVAGISGMDGRDRGKGAVPGGPVSVDAPG